MDFAKYRNSRRAARQVTLPGADSPVYVRLLSPGDLDAAEMAMRRYLTDKNIPLDVIQDTTAAEMKERELTVQTLSRAVFEDEEFELPWAKPDQLRTLDEVAFRYLDHEYDLLLLEERASLDIYSATPEQWEEAKKKLAAIPMSALSGRSLRALGSFLAALSSRG